MSEPHPKEVGWHFTGEEELDRQLRRARSVLRQLAHDAAIRQPAVEPAVPDFVYPEHVQIAAQQLFGSVGRETSPAEIPVDEPFVFISYSHEDAAFVRELCDDLTRIGIATFLDERSIRLAAQWAESLQTALRTCAAVITIMTPRSMSSTWCQIEAGAAWGLQKPFFALL